MEREKRSGDGVAEMKEAYPPLVPAQAGTQTLQTSTIVATRLGSESGARKTVKDSDLDSLGPRLRGDERLLGFALPPPMERPSFDLPLPRWRWRGS